MNSNMAYQEQVWDELVDGKVVMRSPRPSVNHLLLQIIFTFFFAAI